MFKSKENIIKRLEEITKQIENDTHHEGICSKTKKPYKALNVQLMMESGRLIGPPYGITRLFKYKCSGCKEIQYYSGSYFPF